MSCHCHDSKSTDLCRLVNLFERQSTLWVHRGYSMSAAVLERRTIRVASALQTPYEGVYLRNTNRVSPIRCFLRQPLCVRPEGELEFHPHDISKSCVQTTPTFVGFSTGGSTSSGLANAE